MPRQISLRELNIAPIDLKQIIIVFYPFVFLSLLFSKSLPDVLICVIGVLFLLSSYQDKQWGWLRDPVIYAGLALAFYTATIAAPFADKPADTAVKSLLWLRFVLLYAALLHVLPLYRGKLRLPLLICLGVFALASFDALFQYITGTNLTGNSFPGPRLTSFLDRPNIGTFLFKSVYAVASLYLAVMITTRKFNLRETAIFFAVWVFSSVIVLISGERTATIMMLGSLVILMPAMMFFSPARRLLAVTIFSTAIFIVTAVALTQPVIGKRFNDLTTHLGAFSSSPYGHLTFAALDIANDNPLTGIGFKSFEENCKQRIDPDGSRRLCHIHTHNPFLEWLVIAGYPGLLLFSLMVFALLFQVLRGGWSDQRLVVTAVALSALSMTLSPLMFSQNLISNWPGVLAWMSIGTAIASVRLVTPNTLDE